jgi:hypothetical protein
VDIVGNIWGLKERRNNSKGTRTDYHKVSDSVPHRRIKKALELTGVNNTIIDFYKLLKEK